MNGILIALNVYMINLKIIESDWVSHFKKEFANGVLKLVNTDGHSNYSIILNTYHEFNEYRIEQKATEDMIPPFVYVDFNDFAAMFYPMYIDWGWVYGYCIEKRKSNREWAAPLKYGIPYRVSHCHSPLYSVFRLFSA